MGYNRFIAFGAAFAALAMCWAVAAGGGPSDPVVSQSYLEDTVARQIINDITDRVSQKLSDPEKRISQVARDAESRISYEAIVSAAGDIALEELQARGLYWYNAPVMKNITLKAGEVLCGDAGTKAILFSGSGVIYGNPVVNITAGYEYAAGSAVALNNSYFFVANDGSGIRATADCTIGVDGRYKILDAVRIPRYQDLAKALSRMNLVRGTANGFELHRGATRAEAITMLVRLLAEENAAMGGGYTHHFADVDSWADDIVAYSLNRGYANGVSRTRFGASDPTTVNHYMTFLLRVLGYDDTAGDFVWNQAMDYAVKFDVITKEEAQWISSTPFTRDHMVYLSYYALFAEIKGQNITLLDSLIDRGAVSATAAEAAIAQVTRERG